jgi:hypothetical protein
MGDINRVVVQTNKAKARDTTGQITKAKQDGTLAQVTENLLGKQDLEFKPQYHQKLK